MNGTALENPFHIPDTGPRSNRPLCPWKHDPHGQLFVDIDSTKGTFERFANQLGDCSGLREQGRLVIVSGHSRCGKTSMVHRCADHLNKLVNTGVPDKFIIDLTGHPYTADNINARISEILGEATTALSHSVGLVDDDSAPDRAKLTRQVHRLCRTAEELSAVLIILLPSTEVVGELTQYASLVLRNKRIVFFAESADLDGVTRVLNDVRPEDRDEIFRLDVGPLKLEDFWAFAQSRISRYPQGTVHWTTRQIMRRVGETLTEVSPVPVGRWHELLYGLWQSKSGMTRAGLVRAEDIFAYYIKNLDGYRREPRGRDR